MEVMGTEITQTILPINLTELIGGSLPEKVVAKIITEFLKSNPKFISDHIAKTILNEIIGTDFHKEILEGVKAAISVNLNKEASGSIHNGLRGEISKVSRGCVQDQKGQIASIVRNAINDQGQKKNVSDIVIRTIEARIFSALGDVCEGCDRDAY